MALMPYFSTNDGLYEYESGRMRGGQDMKRPRTPSRGFVRGRHSELMCFS